MRVSVIALAVAGVTLAACGQNQSQTTTAPAPLTPDQVKTLVASLPAPFNTGDIVAGRAKFTQCAACHTTAEGGPNMTGPNLYGIFGRKAGTNDGFAYSDALKAAGWTWDAGQIDKWITNPRALLPGTKMTFVGLSEPKDRIDVIAYLKSATSPAP